MADRLVEETRVQLLTVGHGTAAEQDFGGLLAAAGVKSLVDVRIAPGSRKFPHFGRQCLPLGEEAGRFPEAACGIAGCRAAE